MLQGHELYSLKRRSERAPSAHRKWSKDWFAGRVGVIYTVKGKGGLVREVLIPTQLAKELELRHLPEPVTLRNRGINHQQHYNITAPAKLLPHLYQSQCQAPWMVYWCPMAYDMGMRKYEWMNSIPASLPARNEWKSSARN